MGEKNEPAGTNLETEVRGLRRACRMIQTKWRQRRRQADQSPGNDDRSPSERAPAFLKQQLYKLARELYGRAKADNWPFDVETLVRAGCAPRRLDDGPKAIWLGLLAILDAGEVLSRSEWHRYATELDYARKHRIPWELVPGFIWQVGGAKHIARISGRRQPWSDKSLHTPEAFKSPV